MEILNLKEKLNMNAPDLKDVEMVINEDPTYKGVERRQMLRTLGGLLGSAIIGGAVLQITRGVARASELPTGAVRRKHHWGMVIDVRRCIGCKACTMACKQENKTPPGVSYMVVVNEPLEGSGNDRPVPFSKPCFHCENPPCVTVCPVSATFKREQDGIVAMDYDRCIGCRYCMTACPYGARFFDFGERYREEANLAEDVPSPEYGQYRARQHGQSPVGNVRKCQFCMHLQDENGEYSKEEGRWPACAKTCTGKAIHFGDLMDPNSEVSRLLYERNAITLKTELGAKPSVYYLL